MLCVFFFDLRGLRGLLGCGLGWVAEYLKSWSLVWNTEMGVVCWRLWRKTEAVF